MGKDLSGAFLRDAADDERAIGESGQALAGLVALGDRQIALEKEIDDLELRLSTLNMELHTLRTDTLPKAMLAAGARAFETRDGSKVEIKHEYFASIPTEEAIDKAKTDEEHDKLLSRRAAAFAWLRAHKAGDLVKNTIRMTFGKGEDAKAAKLIEWAAKKKIEFSRQESVHPSTLKAFVKEEITKGRELASDVDGREALGVFELDVAKITPKKEKRT